MNDNLLPEWAKRHDEIERLQATWRTQFEKRAAGGTVSLSGFHYQFLIALHDTLRAWRDRPVEERGRPSVLTECLSDILDSSSNDIVLVTQVKRVSRSGSFQDALTELWLVYDLALKVTPNLVPHLRFRVLSRTSELKDFESALKSWHPDELSTASFDLEIFRQRVTVELFFDPEDEILALLANELHATEPTAYVHRWLGLLLSAAKNQDVSGFEYAAKSIWEDLQSIENSSLATPPGVYVWTSKDKPPEDVAEGRVLTGERPQAHHLREGFFAARPTVYGPIATRAQEWSADLASNQDNQLRWPVFWIGGRSGSGKSIALMHVLWLLYESGSGPVLWLGNKTELLRQAIPWALRLKAKNRRVMIGIDDPYAPNTQGNDIVWKEALAVLEGVRQSGVASALPLIICCGPSEQAERMQKDLPEEVSVHLVELPREDREDIFQLRNWYMRRTKKLPPNIGDENILLVQLFFQWETGQDLSQFASRFRGRIKESDAHGKLEGLITSMLCLNRLYVGYPTTAVELLLTPDLQDTFRRLREEHYITQNTSDYGIGLWLAHAHLSNLIYESWYPLQSNRVVRTDHLRRVIAECFEFGVSPSEKLAPLWAISNSIVGSPEQRLPVGRLDQETIANLLPFVYTSRIQGSGGRLPLAELPVWIQLRALCPNEVLTPDPVDEALSCLKVENLDEKGLRLTCHKLLHYCKCFSGRQQAKIIESIIELLIQTPHWHQWAPIADDAYRRTRDPRLVKPILDWVKTNAASKWAERLFAFLFTDNSADPQLLEAARELLPRAGGGLDWGQTALQLMEVSKPEIPVCVLEWAGRNRRQRGACFVLGKLLREGRRVARGWAHEWCARWHTERLANRVLEPLLTLLGPNEDLRNWCLRWIAIEHPHVDTGYTVEKMIKTFPLDPEVLAMGIRWLKGHDVLHGPWQFVWRALYNANPYQMLTSIDEETNLPLSVFPSGGDQLAHDGSALGANQKLVELMPDAPKAWYYLAIGLGKARRYDEEIEALIKATQLDPLFADAWQALGATYVRVGENELALKATLKLTELRPNDPEAWYYLSISHSRYGHHTDQRAALLRAIELDPQFARARWALRNLYDQLGQDELCLEAELGLLGLQLDDPRTWYQLAITCGRDGRHEAQVVALTKATELDPDFADAWQAVGAAYNRLGKNDAALNAALKLTKLRSDDPDAWYFRGISHGKVDQEEDQIAALIKATQLRPHFADAWQALGAVYNQAGQHELALAATVKLTEVTPDDAKAWYYLSVAHRKLDHHEERLAALTRATQLNPHYVEAWQALAVTYNRLGRPELALQAALELTRALPDDPEGWQTLGAIYNDLGQAERALAAAMKLVELTPTDSQAWYYLSVAHGKLGHEEEKITALTKAVQLDPQLVEAWQNLVIGCSLLGQADLALEAALKVTELRPDDPDAWQKLGAVYNSLGRTELAMAANLRLTELTPNDAQAWYYLSIAQSKARQHEERIAALIRATQLDPEFVRAWEALGIAYHQMGRPEQSLAAARRITELTPESARGWFLLGSSYSRAGKHQEALEAAKHLCSLHPEDAHAWYKLGKRHAKLGQDQDAKNAFEKALKLNENLNVARRALGKLGGNVPGAVSMD